jgi:flagellar protein FliJ
MAKHFPLQTLLEHSRHRMEVVERQLLTLKRREDSARARLEDLHGYKREYQQRLAGSGAKGMDIHLLRDFHAFLIKMDGVIQQQTDEVDKAHARWSEIHANWLALRQKVKAYETLAQRHRAQEAARLEKREQRISDEGALRKHMERGDKSGH